MFRDVDELAAVPPSPGKLRQDWSAYLVPQDWAHFTAEEHGVWDTLFARQVPYLGTRIVSPFLDGIPKLGLDRPSIPDLDRLNDRLALRLGAGPGARRCLLRHAGRATLPDRQLHPLGRQPRLSGRAGLLPRH